MKKTMLSVLIILICGTCFSQTLSNRFLSVQVMDDKTIKVINLQPSKAEIEIQFPGNLAPIIDSLSFNEGRLYRYKTCGIYKVTPITNILGMPITTVVAKTCLQNKSIKIKPFANRD